MTRIFKIIFTLLILCLICIALEFLIYGQPQPENRLVDNILTIILILVFYDFVRNGGGKNE